MDFTKKESINHFYKKFSTHSFNTVAPDRRRCFPLHYHEKFELLLINSGGMEILLDSENFLASAGDIVVFAPEQLHQGFSTDDGCDYDALQFYASDLLGDSEYEKQLLENILCRKQKISPVIRDEKAAELFREVKKICKTPCLSQPVLERGHVCMLFSYLLEKHSEESVGISHTDAKFNQVLEYIADNYTEPITTAGIAEKFSYNLSYFCRKFKRATNYTPMDYIISLRIEKAQKLIVSSKYNFTEIAMICGFESYNHFVNHFKKLTTRTPKQWKEYYISSLKR